MLPGNGVLLVVGAFNVPFLEQNAANHHETQGESPGNVYD